MRDPLRGEVWMVDLGQPIGHEAGATRPALVVSDDPANAHGLAVMCPITRTRRGYPTQVEIEQGSSGLDTTSYVQTEQIRTVSTKRLTHRLGMIDSSELSSVERSLRFLLRL
ncbi:MAG TPA: type II toxin-antitoxin system PemK/MazF family toxin [Sporichthyaceae bacterium]|nr:type II toxin-antitoxin system PemK/MazF family toxin [Sporichthyaceae bacterium]